MSCLAWRPAPADRASAGIWERPRRRSNTLGCAEVATYSLYDRAVVGQRRFHFAFRVRGRAGRAKAIHGLNRVVINVIENDGIVGEGGFCEAGCVGRCYAEPRFRRSEYAVGL